MQPEPRPAPPATRGDCPSVHHPFAERDGALVRVRLPGGRLGAGGAAALAAAVEAAGAGPIEITNRANLQVRAVPEAAVASFGDAVVAAGLAPADPQADLRRNVLTSPTAGVDPGEVLDPPPLVDAVAARLAGGAPVASPKFGVLIDGGGSTHLRGRPHDLALGAVRSPSGDVVWEIAIGSRLPEARRAGDEVRAIAGDRALDLVDALLHEVEPHGRSGPMLDAVGAEATWSAVDRRLGGAVQHWVVDRTQTVVAPSCAPVGRLATARPGRVNIGGAPVLGRLTSAQLAAVAVLAEQYADGELRTTPVRGVLFPSVSMARVEHVCAQVDALGISCDPHDPAHHVVACAGETGCASGCADVQADARTLVAILRERDGRMSTNAVVHLSGCEKGCARRRVSTRTLVARPDRTYDWYADDATAAGDDWFGTRLRAGLDPRVALAALAEESFA